MNKSLSDASLDAAWAATIIRTCQEYGADQFFLAPGSRCTPLTLAVADLAADRVLRHFDERGLAYAGVGYAQATGKPAVFICTSGTAVANALPAVVEACEQSLPLLLLTADRPPELRQRGANQTIDQSKIYGGFVRWQFDLPCPSSQISLHQLHSITKRALLECRRGPVHLNCMFREPMSIEAASHARDEILPQRGLDPASSHARPTRAPRRPITLDGGNTLIMLGRCQPAEANAAIQLAERLQAPLAADATSGVRRLYHDLALLRPELPACETVIHIGARLTSKRLAQYLSECKPKCFVHVRGHSSPLDPYHLVTEFIDQPIESVCATIALRKPCPASYYQSIEDASQTAIGIARTVLNESQEISEPAVALLVCSTLPAGEAVFLGNSMPVRDWDRFATGISTVRPTASNRGASGIDGLIASSVGFARGLRGPVTALLGDLSTLHDLNSLAMLREGPPVRVIVLNNDGGGIFHMLPIARSTQFEAYFATPHGLFFQHLASGFGIRYAHSSSMAELEENLAKAWQTDESWVIEVRTDRERNLQLHRQIEQKIEQA